MPHFLGADIGTTNVKAVIVDERQGIVAAASRPLRILRPRSQWSEQNPQSWWSAFLAVCANLRRQAPKQWRDIASIGLAGQMHAAVCLDVRDRPLRSAILWNDGRAQFECGELLRAVPEIRRVAGVIPMPGLTAPKFMWLRRHEPRLFERIAHVLFPKDYVRLKLTGEHVTDMSDAAGSLWLDQATRRWSQPTLDASGMTAGLLPRLAEGLGAVASLKPSIARKLGLPAGVMVAAGGGDAAVGAAGIGAVDDGDAFISLGTSGQYFIARERYEAVANPTVHCFAHCLPSRWYAMAALLNGANCLEWVCRLLSTDIASALAGVQGNFHRPSPVVFLPYLAGERTPHNDPNLRAVFSGLGHATGRLDLIQSVLEGVAFSFADAEDHLRQSDAKKQPLAVIGGAALSPVWMQIFADVLGKELILYERSEMAAPFGAARLARLAFLQEPIASVCAKPKISSRIRPRPAWHESYTRSLERFRRTLPVANLKQCAEEA